MVKLKIASQTGLTLSGLSRGMSSIERSFVAGDKFIAPDRLITYEVTSLTTVNGESGKADALVNPLTVRRGRDVMPETSPEAGILMIAAGLREMTSNHAVPKWLTSSTAQVLQNIPKFFNGWVEVTTSSGDQFRLDDATSIAIDEAFGAQTAARGQIAGWLDGINFHTAPYTFDLFPETYEGPIVCEFEDALKGQVIAALNSFVVVKGVSLYRGDSYHPHRAKVHSLEVVERLPREWGTSLPNYETDGVAEVRAIRDAW